MIKNERPDIGMNAIAQLMKTMPEQVIGLLKIMNDQKAAQVYLDDHPELTAKLLELTCGGHVIVGGAGAPVTVPTKVWRVELPDGHGPFNTGRPDNGKTYDAICNKIVNCAALANGPNDEHEKCGVTDAHFRQAHGCANYGCNSLSWIERWFSLPARQYLKDKVGAECNVYELPVGAFLLQLHNGEVIFAKPEAKLIETLDLVTLEEVKS